MNINMSVEQTDGFNPVKAGSYQQVDNSAAFAASIMGEMSTKTRDEDGTIDRVRDPPPELLPVLAAIREKCKVEGVYIESIFQEAGASHFGTMPTARFISALTVGFPRFKLDQEIYVSIVMAYGIGYKNPLGHWESIAWKDFCEDVGKAKDTTPHMTPSLLAHARSAVLSYKTLAMTPEALGLVEPEESALLDLRLQS